MNTSNKSFRQGSKLDLLKINIWLFLPIIRTFFFSRLTFKGEVHVTQPSSLIKQKKDKVFRKQSNLDRYWKPIDWIKVSRNDEMKSMSDLTVKTLTEIGAEIRSTTRGIESKNRLRRHDRYNVYINCCKQPSSLHICTTGAKRAWRRAFINSNETRVIERQWLL